MGSCVYAVSSGFVHNNFFVDKTLGHLSRKSGGRTEESSKASVKRSSQTQTTPFLSSTPSSMPVVCIVGTHWIGRDGDESRTASLAVVR